METLSEAIARLEARASATSFRAEQDGRLWAQAAERFFAPEALVVEEVVRFEGESDPDEEAILFALRSPSGDVRGTFTTGYGVGADPASAEIVRGPLALRRAGDVEIAIGAHRFHERTAGRHLDPEPRALHAQLERRPRGDEPLDVVVRERRLELLRVAPVADAEAAVRVRPPVPGKTRTPAGPVATSCSKPNVSAASTTVARKTFPASCPPSVLRHSAISGTYGPAWDSEAGLPPEPSSTPSSRSRPSALAS